MNKSGIASSVLSHPSGGGAIGAIGEAFSPDLHTGTGNLSVPILLPRGRNGFQPQLALGYSTGQGNGPFGLGWRLDLPAITRDTSAGVPTYDDDVDGFVLSGAERLIPVGDNRYRPRTERGFARIERRGDGWEVRTRSGLVHRYGASLRDPDADQRVFAWGLSETVDPYGNRIELVYERDAVREDGPHHWDQRYLAQIRYADHGERPQPQFLITVDFIYEDRPDPFSSYRSGFEIRTVKRCARIEIRTHADTTRLARVYRFHYSDDPFSLLARVEVEGVDGDARESLPPLEFRYSAFRPGEHAYLPLRGALPERSLAHPDFELADLSGTGMPDIVQIGEVSRYWKNLGDGQFDAPRELPGLPGVRLGDRGVMLADADGDGHVDLVLSEPAGYVPLTPADWRTSLVMYRAAPPFALEDPEVRLLDLDGDGVTDALRTGASFETYYHDAGDGWTVTGVHERRRIEDFPDIHFSDPRVKLADMTGDGLIDIVLLDGDRVDYWPNLGHGKWGTRVTMRGRIVFPDGLLFGGLGFDPKRVLLGDIDGDGLADLVYVESGRVTTWHNRSGNEWSDPVVIAGTPPITNADAVRLADVLGVGTAGVLWSYDAGTFADGSYKFLDFTGGKKPHLLVERDNHAGARTRIEYAPSTRFYLADEPDPETRWQTSLPFPVHVVARVEVTDELSGGRLTTEYRYHHGYWDGAEREFRGFGMVEQLDSESFGRDSVDGVRFSPPTLTRTWFHQGEVQDGTGRRFESSVLGPIADAPAFALTTRRELASIAETASQVADPTRMRDALRALHGSVLRTELFARDDAPERDRAYTVTESLYDVRELVAPEDERPGVFTPLHVATRSTRWERGDDPMSRFVFTGDFDPYGQARAQMEISVPRGRDPSVALTSALAPYLATSSKIAYAQRDEADRYMVDRVARSTRYEVRNDGTASVFGIRDAVTSGSARHRLIGDELTYFDGAAFEGLPLGEVGDYGAPVRREALAFEDAFLVGTTNPGYLDPNAPTWTAEYPAAFRASLPAMAGYVHRDAEPAIGSMGGYYLPRERLRYDFQSAEVPRGQPRASRDALGAETTIELDSYELLPIRVADPAGLVTTAVQDYRVLAPRTITDPNGTVTEASYSPTGMLASLAVRGKDGEGDATHPGVRFEYDLRAFDERREPISVRTIRRAHHDSEVDVDASEREKTIETLEYSDGLGRLLQTRTQRAEEGGAVVSGWQTYDNKGQIVEKYEPFFGVGWAYRPPGAAERGQRVTMFYDPRGQLIRTIRPDGAETRVVLGVPIDLGDPSRYAPTPWESFVYDANDNAGRTHPDESTSFRSHWNTPSSVVVDALGRTIVSVARNGPDPAVDWLTTRSSYDIQGRLVAVVDPLGREAFRYIHDLAGRCWRTTSIDAGQRDAVFDVLGRAIEARDSKGALALQDFDAVGRPRHTWARDSAASSMQLRTVLAYGDVSDATALAANQVGRLVSQHDGAGVVRILAYDFKGNVIESSRRVIADAPLAQAYVTAASSGWQITAFSPSWDIPPGSSLTDLEMQLLDPEIYETTSTFDALGRVTTAQLPRDVGGARRVLVPRYNGAGALDQVSLDSAVVVEHIAYDAHGRRELVAYGNGTTTHYTYDARTFRLARLRTDAPGGPVQDVSFAYDVVGNILSTTDRTSGSGILDNPDAASVDDSGLAQQLAAGDALIRRFTYDPIYRLREATGRECDQPPESPPWLDEPRGTDLTKTQPYLERYEYDAAGNLALLAHRNASGGFTRTYLTQSDSNRLARLQLGPATSIDYARDLNGNTLSETSSRHFEWDFADRLKSFRTQTTGAEPSVHAQYLYDASGARVKKLVRTQGGRIEVTHYIDGTFEHRRWNTGENNHILVADGARSVASVRVGDAQPGDPTPAVTYQLADHLGSVTATLDATGAVINREEVTPYGETSFGSYAKKRYRFTGVERDEESSLSYHGARYYAPWLGRWASCDPTGASGGVNLYAYAAGNPICLRDTRGTDPEPALTKNADGYYELPGETIYVQGTAPDRAVSNFVIGADVMSAAEFEREAQWHAKHDGSDRSWRTGPPDEWSRTVDPEQAYAEGAARRSRALSIAYAGYVGGKAAEWETATRRMATAAVVAKVGVVMLATGGAGATVAAPYMLTFGPHVLRGLALLSAVDHVRNYQETGDERELGRGFLDYAGASLPESSSTSGPLLSGPGGVDPGLATFVTRLQSAGIKVLGVNVGIAGEGGLLGEVDVVTENALIQFKDGGSSAKRVIEQVTLKTEPYVDRPVVAFINGAGRDAARAVRYAGRYILVTNDFGTLVDVIK